MMRRFILGILSMIFRLFPIRENVIVLESEGDFSDNSYALFDYLMRNQLSTGYAFVWLVDNLKNTELLFKNSVKLISKSKKSHFFKKYYFLSICKYYIFDHNNYFEYLNLKKKNDQYIVDLWHGCGFKFSEYATRKSNVDYLFTVSELFSELHAKLFNISKDHVFDYGYPRNDYFYMPLNDSQVKVNDEYAKYSKVLFWMPTFRRSYNKSIDEVYFENRTGLPILDTEEKLGAFDEFLKNINVLCIFKIHHLQAALEPFQKKYSNIIIVNDDDIHKMGLQQYQYVMLSDLLVTDYSSIATDYLLLNKPMVFTLDDYDEYEKSRGFLCDNVKQYLPGYHVYNESEFFEAIKEIAEGKDPYKKQRMDIMSKMHTHIDGDSCSRIVDLLGIAKR